MSLCVYIVLYLVVLWCVALHYILAYVIVSHVFTMRDCCIRAPPNPRPPTLKVVLEKDEVLLNGLVRAKFQDEAERSHKAAVALDRFRAEALRLKALASHSWLYRHTFLRVLFSCARLC